MRGDLGEPERSAKEQPLAGPRVSAEPPLVVDLDGTLVATDTLVEGALALVRRNPVFLVRFFVWLWQGRTVLKAEIAARQEMNYGDLPWRRDLIAFLEKEKRAGRSIVLATAASEETARRAAAYLGLFDEAISSTEAVNLKGPRKCDELVKRYGVRGFDYVGDSSADIPVWRACRIGHVAGPLGKLPAEAIRNGAREGESFGKGAGARTWMRALRVHQWGKNLLVFVAPLLNHHLSPPEVGEAAAAFVSFCMVASAGYLTNDLFDLRADRAHPNKRRRALASGAIPIPKAIAAAAALATGGLLMGAMGGEALGVCLAIYIALTALYSVFLKGKPIIDVITLTVLYTLRVFAGGVVTGAYISPWLVQFSIFLFLSLAFMKRYSELMRLRELRRTHAPSRSYRLRDLHIVSQAGVASGAVAALVLALYVNGQEVEHLYPRPRMLWAVCPLFIYWIMRAWLVAHRGNMADDPIVFALRDKVSYIVGGLIAIAVAMGLFPGILPNVH
ncbi:MAG: UbiA family prenyltransferase [Acidobacteriota bacterium]|nr:UbiA family prenyltransferase [Acidobacteriota bacterium]